MDTFTTRNVARRAGLLATALVLSALSHAGTFAFTSGAWSSLTGTAATIPSLVETSSTNPVGAISVKATASGTQTLQGTWSFSVTWTPATVGETPPANVKVLFKKAGTPTVDGNGIAKITAASTDLLKVDSTNLILSDVTKYLPDVTVTVPLVLQTNGTYKASGSVTSDLLSATYNSQSSTVTKCVESFTVSGMEASI